MKRVVFYSWQSDLEPAITRTFIEDALKDVVRKIAADATLSVEPVLDRDTAGVAGTPAIVDTLLSKIAMCDVFVGDVSITNAGTGQRPTPNPNVLVELGFAVARVGWERILLIQNIVFGEPEELPFDLRHRRVIPYTLGADSSNQAEMGTVLRERVEVALRQILGNMTSRHVRRPPNEPMWWGYWETPQEYEGQAWGGSLFIHEVGASGFLFQLVVFSGSHSGYVAGFARFIGPDAAYATISVSGDALKQCELSFRRSLDHRREIAVEEGGDCRHFRGMGASFGGHHFVRTKEAIFEMGVLDELDPARLYSITGEFYRPLMQRFQQIGSGDNKDQFTASVTIGGVRGLFTLMEGILMRGPEGQLWVAYIDSEVVRYFTTEPEHKQTLPVTIEEWRQRFKDKRVIVDSPVKTIPTLHP